VLNLCLSREEFPQWLKKQPCKRKVDEIILHHTWRPTMAQYKGEQTIKSIQQYHISQGWKDIGYHFLIAPDGNIWAGRPVEEIGAHTRGRNTSSIGVCLIGNFDEEEMTDAQEKSLIVVLRALLHRFKLQTSNINFHRDYAPYKSCPGLKLDKEAVRSSVEGAEEESLLNADDAISHPDVPAWATDAVKWALSTGIVKGTAKGKIEGYRPATRAEVIVMLHRLFQLISKGSS